MKIKDVPIEDLNPSEYNPRALTEKEYKDLKESLKRFDFVEPIVVNSAESRKNVVIGGHQRLIVAKEMGYKTIPVNYVKITKLEKEQELNLRLNKNLGHFDYDLLANYDEEMLVDVGFSREELDDVFGLNIDEEFDVDKELEKLLKGGVKRVKDGDLWQLGEHRLVIGDCTNRSEWDRLLGNERFDFMFTDPPYKLAYTKRARKIQTKEGVKLKKDKVYESVGKTDGRGRFKGWVKTKNGFGYRSQRSYLGVEKKGGVPEYDEWLSIANDFQNPKGANVMVFENWRNTIEIWQAIAKYWKIKNMVIWWLPNRCQGFSRPGYFFNKYDIAILGDKNETKLNEGYEEEMEKYLRDRGQKLLDTYEVIIYGQKGKGYWDRRKGTLWAKVADHITHAAETGKSGGQNIIFGTKPIQILVPYIKILSPRNGIIAEPFAGAGSTLIASEVMHRKCRAMEIEPIYGEVILLRYEKFTGKEAVKINK